MALTFSFKVGGDGDGAAVVFGRGALRGGFSWGNRESIDDDKVNLTVRLGLAPLPVRTVAGGVATLDSDVEPRRRDVVDLVFPPMLPYDGVSPRRIASAVVVVDYIPVLLQRYVSSTT
jgi:hypothetical protein